jgi:hypothetical protein
VLGAGCWVLGAGAGCWVRVPRAGVLGAGAGCGGENRASESVLSGKPKDAKTRDVGDLYRGAARAGAGDLRAVPKRYWFSG